MDIDAKSLQKNLTKKEINAGKKENILNNNLKNNIISHDIADKNKTLNKDKLINTQKVNTGLRADDAEYLQDVIDMDLYREQIINFENLPKYRLAQEKSILKKGPQHMKGCTKWWARKKWKKKQKGRVKAAEKLLKKHTKLIAQYDKYKADRLAELEQLSDNAASFYSKQELEKQGLEKQGLEKQDLEKQGLENQELENLELENLELENQGLENQELENQGLENQELENLEQKYQGGNVAGMLDFVNENLARDAILNLNQSRTESINELDTFLKNYVIDEGTAEADRQAKTAKDQAKRKKKADKTGKVAADEEIIQNREDLENELLDRRGVKNRTLKTEVNDLDGGNAVQLADLSQLFKKVLSDSEKPITEEREVDGKVIQMNLSAERFVDIRKDAEKVLNYTKDLGIAVPEELYYLLKLEDNPLLKSGVDKFVPEEHANEAYVLLMSATSKLFYEALNRYAGYWVFDGLEKYYFMEDKERNARNFDIFNVNLMTHVRNVRDMSSAYANEIRKNRLKVYEETVPADQIQDQNMRENIELLKGAQPTGMEEEKKEEKVEENKQEKIYEEWRELLAKDIRGTVEVDQKDMKQTPWVLKDYQEQIFNIMKNNPDCDGLTGEPLKRYLIAMNDNLRSNLLQLTDELPKTSVGAKFCYIPKLRDDFIEKIKTEKFGMLLRPDFFYRDLLRNNSVLDDLFNKPQYKAAKNRQREIMKAINEELGMDFYTNVKHLSSLWSNDAMQEILLSVPSDKEAQENFAKEEILKKQEGDKKEIEKKEGNILNYAVQKFLSNSQSYGVSDNVFKETINKLKATVHDNIAVIDRKISLMGICDTAKDALKRNLLKRMGGEYLLGYNVISQEIVEYTIDNMMVFDGTAATIQRTWDRKFARTGLPSRLSTKMERLVADKINAKGKRDEYYLRPKGFKVSRSVGNKWEETNKKTNAIINSLKKLYNNDIKDFMKNYTESDELRNSVSNAGLLYIGDKVKLSKRQWEQIEDYFENKWLEVFKDSYINGDYSQKDVKSKLGKIKQGLSKIINVQLTKNYDARQGFKNDASALKEYEDTLVTRDEFTDGLSKNAVIAEPKIIVTDDIKNQIFNDPALKGILKSKEDREILNQVLGEELRDEKSTLHTKLAYLDDVRSIEQLGNLSLIDYSDFFSELKSILCVMDDQKLLLEDWRMRGQAGADYLGVKRRLLKDFFKGGMTRDVLTANAKKYEEEAEKASSVDMKRIDAYLNTEANEEDTNVRFNYLNVVGKEVNQTERIKRLSYAQKLWYRLQKADETKHVDGRDKELVKRFSNFIQIFISNQEGKKPSQVVKNIKNLGALFDRAKITREEVSDKKIGNFYVDTDSKNKLLEAGFIKNDVMSIRDGAVLKTVQDIFKQLVEEDTAAKKMTFEDCMGELLLFGCGKEYFEAGGEGEKTFLDSKDEQYYMDILAKSKDFFTKRALIEGTLNAYEIPPSEKNNILLKLKPVIAGIKESNDKKDMAENVRKYGVGNTMELMLKLQEMYAGTEEEKAAAQKKSREVAEVYKARVDYIDNYGTGFEHGKFRIVRNYMLKDKDIWRNIMTMSDEDFMQYIEEQNRLYGKGLDLFRSADFRASGPINEMYVMNNWSDFKNRADWDKMAWYTSLNNFNSGFMAKKVGGWMTKKSVQSILTSLEKKMVSAGYDANVKNSQNLRRLQAIMSADPAAFNLLYNENDMFEALKRVDDMYKVNMDGLMNMMTSISAKGEQPYADNEEDDKLYKEIATLYFHGDGIEKKLGVVNSVSKLRELEENAKKGKKLTEDDKIYADYSLLMQIIRPYAYGMKKEDFMKGVLGKFKEFKKAQQLDRNANIYSDRNVLDTKDAIRLELEIKKNEGKTLERQFNKELSDYSEKKAVLGSVGLLAYNADPKFDDKTVTKASEFVEKNLSGDFGTANEDFIKGLLTERAVAFGLKKEDDLKAALTSEKMRLVSLDKALRNGGLADEDQIKKAIVFAFAQNANRIALPLDGTHEGDVKEILDELKEREAAINIKEPASAIAKRAYEEFMDDMDIARFTMTKEQFKEVCDKKRRYFEMVDAVVLKINAATANPKEQLGLFNYFKKDIFEALSAEQKADELTQSVTEQIDRLIGDKTEGRNDLDAESIRKITLSYLPDSSVLMQHIDNNSLTAEERLLSSEKYTRADIEREIAMSGKKELIERYNSLTVEEQKVFAIALTFPDIGLTTNEKFSSNEAVRDKAKEEKREIELQEDLAAYIYDQDFAPKIDYNVVMKRLMKTDRKSGTRRVSVTMFDKAFKYTQFCMMKRNEMRPKDYSKLADGEYTGDIGRTLSGMAEQSTKAKEALSSKEYYGAKTFREYFKNFAKNDIEKDDSVAKIADKFGKLNNTQINMLLHVLQDRTAIDYTTGVGFWNAFTLGGVSFVNVERREAIKNSFMRPDGMDHDFIAELNRSITHEMFEKAAQTLFSYQLRDDIDLSKRLVDSNTFAKDALKRTTSIDWKMLDRAMDLVKEIEEENLRIQLCRQTVEHTTDPSSPNVAARTLGKEIDEIFREETTNHFDYFRDFLAREAKKNPDIAMPMLSAFSGMSDNEKMLVVHALRHRDILDVSTDGTFTTAIGQNENRYVNEVGRDQLADYYIDHFSTPGQTNVMAASQYDVRDAMKSLVSTQVSDARDAKNKKNFADMMVGKKIFNWTYVGGRSTGVDWELFGNALKFVKRTEGERKLLTGEAESYRAAGDINKYGRFMYNYSFLRKNQYRSGFRLTRFIGRRVRAEIEANIPGYGVAQRVLMVALGPKMQNKMRSTGIVKAPQAAKNKTTEYAGYAALGGTSTMGAGSALKMVTDVASTGGVVAAVGSIAGEALQQTASAFSAMFNVGSVYADIAKIDKLSETSPELVKERNEKRANAQKVQNDAQKMVTKDNQLNKEWIINEVSGVAAKSANQRDIVETVTTFVNVASGSSIGISAITNVFVGGIKAAITETLNTARFIMSVCQDKKMMDRYFDNKGPLGKEIQALRGDNIQKVIDDQKLRSDKGTRHIYDDATLRKSETEFMGKMSNTELFRKAYGFKDFSEQASYVGWNIVQTLMQSCSPFGTDPVLFMKSSLLLAAIGCKDVIGKQDNESAQRVYDKLMGQDIR